jgi:hypothetical protein
MGKAQHKFDMRACECVWRGRERANDDGLIPDPERSGRRENSTNSTRNGRQMTSPGSATRIIDNESLFCRSSDAIAKYSENRRKTLVNCRFGTVLVEIENVFQKI